MRGMWTGWTGWTEWTSWTGGLAFCQFQSQEGEIVGEAGAAVARAGLGDDVVQDVGQGGQRALTPKQMQQPEKYYGSDKSPLHAYFIWLRAWPRATDEQQYTFRDGTTTLPVELPRETTGTEKPRTPITRGRMHPE